MVTGATGFIGRHLVAGLEARGLQVRAVARHATAWPTPVDPASADAWSALVDGAGAVVHLAAIAHQPLVTGDPLARRASQRRLRRINVTMTAALARAASRAGVDRFVFVSSIKAIGDSAPVDQPLREADRPAPADCYGLAKLAAERRLERIAAGTDLDVVMVRPPLVFGPGVKANFARLASLAGWSGRGLPLPLASIRNRRSLVHVDNLVSALIRILEIPSLPDPPPGRHARLYHVADEPALSTPELLRRLAATGQRRARLAPFPVAALVLLARLAGRSAEIDRLTGSLVVDGSRFRRDFEWTPPVAIDLALAGDGGGGGVGGVGGVGGGGDRDGGR